MSTWYQHMTGDKQGEVEVFSHESNDIIYFKSGLSVTKKELSSQFLPINNIDDIQLFNKNTKEEDMAAGFKDYPTKEELDKYKSGDGYSMGQTSENDYAPLPDDSMIYPKGRPIKKTTNNDMLKGLAGVDEPFIDQLEEVAKKDSFAPVKDDFNDINAPKKYEKNAVKKDDKCNDAVSMLIDMAKKDEVDIDLSFSAKIPIEDFFKSMDPSFVSKNKNAIINMIVSKIKTAEIDKQLKEKIKTFYGI